LSEEPYSYPIYREASIEEYDFMLVKVPWVQVYTANLGGMYGEEIGGILWECGVDYGWESHLVLS